MLTPNIINGLPKTIVGDKTFPGDVTFSGTVTMGTFSIEEDSGAVTLVDMAVSDTPSDGTEESISFKIDGNTILKMYSEADGSGAVDNKRLEVPVLLSVDSAESKTISSGAISVTSSYVEVVVEGGTGSGADDLSSASGGAEGSLLILKPATSGANDQVTVKNGTGSGAFILAGGADFVMDSVNDRIMLVSNGTEWVELARSSGG